MPGAPRARTSVGRRLFVPRARNGQIARAATGGCPNAHGGNGPPIRRTAAMPDDALGGTLAVCCPARRRLSVPRARMGKLPAPLLTDAQMPMTATALPPSGAPRLYRDDAEKAPSKREHCKGPAPCRHAGHANAPTGSLPPAKTAVPRRKWANCPRPHWRMPKCPWRQRPAHQAHRGCAG